MPAVDGQRQCTPHPRVVKGRAGGVEGDSQVAGPRALAHLDAVADRLDHLIALGGGEAAELGHDAALFHGFHLRGTGDEIGPVAVEIRPTDKEVLVPALACPVVPFLVLDKDEWPGPEHMGLREEWILLELGRVIDAVPGRSEVRQHRCVRPLQMKDHGRRIGRLH